MEDSKPFAWMKSDSRTDKRPVIDANLLARLDFHGNGSPMWIFDQGTLAFMEVNEAAISLYGYSRKEFMSMTILDIRPAEDIPKLLRSNMRPDKWHESESEPWRHMKKDGTVIDVEVTTLEVAFNHRPAELALMRWPD